MNKKKKFEKKKMNRWWFLKTKISQISFFIKLSPSFLQPTIKKIFISIEIKERWGVKSSALPVNNKSWSLMQTCNQSVKDVWNVHLNTHQFFFEKNGFVKVVYGRKRWIIKTKLDLQFLTRKFHFIFNKITKLCYFVVGSFCWHIHIRTFENLFL